MNDLLPPPPARAPGPLAAALGLLAGVLAADVLLGMLLTPRAVPLFGALLPERRWLAEAALAGLLAALALAARARSAWALATPAGAAALLVAFACANTRLIGSSDTLATRVLPFSLLRHGTLSVDRNLCVERGAPMYSSVVGPDGRRFSRYPVATALLALPLLLPAAVGPADPCEGLGGDAEKLAAALLSALALALLCAAARATVGRPAAALTTAALGLGTGLLPIASQALWQHTGAVLCAALAVRALVAEPRPLRRALQVGLGVGLLVACRPPDLLLGLGLFWALWRKEPALRGRLTALAACALPLVLVAAYHAAVFGGPLRTGYGAEAGIGWHLAQMPLASLGLLVSPGRGLLVYSPVLLLAVPALRLGPLGAAALANVALLSAWWAWDGGWCTGPRMLLDSVPLFTPALALGFERALAPGGRRVLAATLLAVSVGQNCLVTLVFPPPLTHALVREAAFGPWTPRAWPPAAYALGFAARGHR